MELPLLLQYLAKSLGHEEITLVPGEALTLRFDNLRVHLEPDPETDRCHVYSVLTQLPTDEKNRLTLFQNALIANNFGRGTGPAFFSLDDVKAELLLETSFAPAETEPERFRMLLADFVTVVDIWDQRIRESVDQSQEPIEVTGSDLIRA
jgi:Tir chaperone protein (CesT) family